MSGPGPDWGALLSGWDLSPAAVAVPVAAALAYAAGVARIRFGARAGHHRRRWPASRSAAFGAGLVVLAAAQLSGLQARADEQLSSHMLQHLLITTVAAALLVGGAPLSLALQATTGATRRRLADLIRSRPVRWLTAPPVTLGAFVAVTLATHLTGFYDAAVRLPLLHGVEHALYLGTGVLFWLPLVGANPVPQLRSFAGRTIYLMLAMPVMNVVGVALVSSTSVRYPVYAEAARATGASALADQEAAGALMWVGGTVVMGAALLMLAFGAMLAEERRQRARDALSLGGEAHA